MTEKQFDQYKQLHKEMWEWLAANPTQTKSQWPRWELNGGDVADVTAGCFMCEVIIAVTSLWCGARCCTNSWSKTENNFPFCCAEDSPYRGWFYAQWKQNWTEVAQFALDVANLEWKNLEEIRRENGLL